MVTVELTQEQAGRAKWLEWEETGGDTPRSQVLHAARCYYLRWHAGRLLISFGPILTVLGLVGTAGALTAAIKR